jgi:hypothetical protein
VLEKALKVERRLIFPFNGLAGLSVVGMGRT